MANILLSYVEVFKKARPYSLYVLFVMLTTYMLNQLDRYTLSITNIKAAQDIHFGDMACMKLDNVSKEEGAACKNITTKADCEDYHLNGTKICKYDYNGQGLEYQIVAGPAFILVFTFTGIILSLFADRFRQWRVFILAGCLAWWSAMTILTGFIESYWQLVVLRFGLGFGEAGCNPLATSLITDYFPIELRGAALGIYNWGIYLGYSMSFAIGNQILKHLSWRWVYYISGIPGFVVAILIVLTVRRPKPPEETSINYQTLNLQQEDSNATKLKKVIKEFFKPSILFLCLAGSIRNAAGYVWGYNNNTYYKMMGQTPDQISSYLGTIPLVFGIIGSFVGGFVSDRVAKQAKPWIRIWVLVFSQISAAPFVFGVLYFKPPVSYYFLIPAYVFGEMWVGVCLSVLVELVPEKLRTTGIGFYFFVISNIGGNMQTFVPLVQDFFKKTFKLNNDDAFRAALYLFYPGEYVIGAALFLLTLFVLKRDLNRMQANVIDENASVRDLIVENSTAAAADDENENENEESDDKSSGISELVD